MNENAEDRLRNTLVFEQTSFVESFDGAKLFVRYNVPKQYSFANPKLHILNGIVLGLHGFGEHSGRYSDVAKLVCSHNYAFVNFDMRGHGQSLPTKGDAPNAHALVLDVLALWQHAKSSFSLDSQKNPFFGILGHSFGSLMATYAAPLLSFDAPHIFLSAPCYKVSQKVPAWKKKMATTLPKLVPSVQVPVEIKPEVLSENPDNNAAYLADELNMFSISLRYGQTFLQVVNEDMAASNARRLSQKVVMAFGAKDTLCDPAAMERVFSHFPSSENELHILRESGHEIFNEVWERKIQALGHLNSWLAQAS